MAVDPGALLTQATSHALAYRRSLAEDPRLPSADYHAMLQRFAGALPEHGTAAGEVIEALATQAVPGLMPMAGPRFFGWVIGASHPAGVAADWLVSAWGQNSGFHSPTPATAAIEAVAERWLVDVLDLPPESSVGFRPAPRWPTPSASPRHAPACCSQPAGTLTPTDSSARRRSRC